MTSPHDPGDGAQHLAAMEAMTLLYQEQLRDHPDRQRAHDELARLGLDPAGEAIRAFRVGHAPSDAHQGTLGGRLVLPVVDESGHVVALIGRAIRMGARPGEPLVPRYVTSPESAVYAAGRTVYGLWQARGAIRERGRAVLVEGVIDVLVAHAAGDAKVVTPLGMGLTAAHARLLARLTSHVTILHDEDHAGRVWAAHAGRLCTAEGLDVVTAAPAEPEVVSPETLRPWSTASFRG